MGIFKSKEEKERKEALMMEKMKREESEKKEMEGLFETYLLTCSALDYCENKGLDIRDYEMRRISSDFSGPYCDIDGTLFGAQKGLVDHGRKDGAEAIVGITFYLTCDSHPYALYTGTELVPKKKASELSF